MSVINGVVIGIVTNVRKGEAKVKFPWLHQRDEEERESNWARIATAMAGNDKGTFLMPEVGDEVLVAFEQGDFNHPYIIGFLWNGKDKPPENDTKKRVIKTKSGHRIELNDNSGQEKIVIESQGGQRIEINDIPAGSITIKTKLGNEIKLDESAGGSISLTAIKDITLSAPTIALNAPNITLGSMVTLTPGSFTINAPTVQIIGVTTITGATTITGVTLITGATTIVGTSPLPPLPPASNLTIT